jgi:hypothetical protein
MFEYIFIDPDPTCNEFYMSVPTELGDYRYRLNRKQIEKYMAHMEKKEPYMEIEEADSHALHHFRGVTGTVIIEPFGHYIDRTYGQCTECM